jgi:Spy/CpxP family protein refolding chaperone
MRNIVLVLAGLLLLIVAVAGAVAAQESAPPDIPAREQFGHIHTADSLEDELAHLTRDLELTPAQQQRVRGLLVQHQSKIQALFDQNPTASRQELGPQIHAISDQTHQQIHALLSAQQQALEKAMVEREHGDDKPTPSP